MARISKKDQIRRITICAVLSALSLVLMVMILICLGVLNYFTDNDDDGGVLI